MSDRYTTYLEVLRSLRAETCSEQVVVHLNPYVLTTLAMCAVVLVALVGTAYLAVFFNRRAKVDLQTALDPLATVVDGTVHLDEAEVVGSYGGYSAFGRMANASEGPGRVFQVDILDATGGVSWVHTSNQHASSGQPPTVHYQGPDDLEGLVSKVVSDHIDGILEPERERFRVEYLRDQGLLRFIRSIRSRREIPNASSFEAQLDMMRTLAVVNRSFMQAYPDQPEAEETSGERT